MRLLLHWFYMARATVWLFLTFARARWYFGARALHDLQLPPAESLTSAEKRRLQHYFYGGTFLSIIFCMLRGRTRTTAEKHRLTNQAALAYFFDDLVDSFQDRDDSGVLWQDNPEEYGVTADDHRGLALHFLHNIYDELPPPHLSLFKSTMHRVFNVETSGRQKTDLKPTLQETDQITREKGGYSVLLFRMIHEPLPSPEEHQALLEFGHLIQYCDDIFDLYFDHQAGIHTVATILALSDQIPELSAGFQRQISHTKQAFRSIPTHRYRFETALCAVHYISSITFICLRHYEQLHHQMGKLPIDNRPLMIVDMEKWKNRFQTAWILAMKP